VLKCLIQQGNQHLFHPVIEHLGNISETEFLEEKPSQCYSFIVKGKEYFIPFTSNFDVEAEKSKILDELKYTEGFLNMVQKKLSNEGFVAKAPPAVLESERKKEADAQSKLALLHQQLQALSGN
jgi:valyl-tRNA synthetase